MNWFAFLKVTCTRHTVNIIFHIVIVAKLTMGCGSSSPKPSQPVRSRDKGDIILTSEVTDSDFKSTQAQPKKPAPQSNGTTQRQTKPSGQLSGNKTHHTNNNNGAVIVNSIYSKPPSVESGTNDLLVENVEDLTGSDVKPKPSRKKKSQIMSDPEMFKAIDSHVARVIQQNSLIWIINEITAHYIKHSNFYNFIRFYYWEELDRGFTVCHFHTSRSISLREYLTTLCILFLHLFHIIDSSLRVYLYSHTCGLPCQSSTDTFGKSSGNSQMGDNKHKVSICCIHRYYI